MRRIALLFLAFPLAAAAAPPEHRPASRIEAVAVYQGVARVTRRAQVDLPAGPSRVLLEGLPELLLDDSIRVEGRGTARTQLVGVTVEREARAASDDPAVVAAREVVERLEAEARALADRKTAAENRKTLLESLRSTWVSERTENLAVRKADPREWQALLDFTTRELSAVLEEFRKIDAEGRELSLRLNAARAELQKLQAKAATYTKTVAVELDASRGGALDLDVSYQVQGAHWSPVWDARLDPESGELRLALRASIAQSTGEDWKNVRLEVSTAVPNRSLVVPDLPTAWLDRYRPVRAAPPPRAAAGAPVAEKLSRVAKSESYSSYDAADEEAEAVDMVQPAAVVQEGLLSASFRVERRETVEGAGLARRVFLAEFPLEAKLVRLAAPRIDPQVYLVATATNQGVAPLLPGPVSIFLGSEYVGRSHLPAVPPGGEVELAFGADDRVRVERKVIERHRDTRGLLGKDDSIRYRVRTTVENLYGKPVQVKLLDRVPVSRDGDIEVEILDGSTPPTEQEDSMKPGVRTYVLDLPAKKEKAVELRYEVRWPKNTAVTGLE
jgi:uncharacterized protein (TIGR02231 family)